jgi:Ni/Co efflux regulator RcnB
MRRIIASVIALAVLGIAAPIAAISSADARTVIIKKDRGHHYGWDKHRGDRRGDRGRHRGRGAKVIINR